ncbi:hypothetical protein R3I94_008848 [Phoxinus phoxinus]
MEDADAGETQYSQ